MAETHATTAWQRISSDSFHKKRTGFGPHFCDDLFPDYNAADQRINLMRGTLRLLSFRFLKAFIMSFDVLKILARLP